MVSSQFSSLNGDCRQKPALNQLLLPRGPPDSLPSDYVEFDFNDVFGPAPVQASLEVGTEISNVSELVYDDPAVIHSRSHSFVGPSSYVSQSLKLSKLTLHETEDSLELVEGISEESQETQKELSNPVDGAILEKSIGHTDDLPAENRCVGLEDFEVLKVVGQGAFAKVYQVRRSGTSEIYAMKVMRKDKIVQKNHSEYMKSERDILTKVDHPFIVQLRYSFQTKYRLYLVLDFVNGGHLFFQLYRQGLFREDLARIYTAEIVSAVSHLHANGVMHRDLKPENILLDADGHVMLTDFGLAKQFDENTRSNSMCGTLEYMSPEIVLGKGHDKAADWWSVGILLFEMLTGKPPFTGGNRQKIQQKIIKDKMKLPAFLSSEAHSLLRGLLQKDASKRLGSSPGGSEEIKSHKWFKAINWRKLEAREISPSFLPEVAGQHCVANFEECYFSDGLLGTSHLKRHITMGICPVTRQKNQQTPPPPGFKPGNATDPPKRRYRTSPGLTSIPFNQDHCSQEIAKMIIMHDYPPHIVEHPGFIDFVHTLQPQFNVVSFNTIQGDCVALYLKEKQSLMNFIREIPGRVNLTLDLWISNQTLGYAILTGHFIDGDWNLHRRILNVVTIPSPDSDFAFNQALVVCLSDWHLESKLLTLTLDKSFSNDTINRNLRGFIPVKNPLMLHGQLLIGNCYARVISRLAQDALGAMEETIKKIRESVKYVKTSDAHEERFFELKEQLQVPSTKDLFIDDQTKWNTTYHMLVAANELMEVFACLESTDPDYMIAPSMEDWKQVEILCIFLKYFLDAANILTSSTYPTASVFYHEVSKIQLELTQASVSGDSFISNLTRPLKEAFDEYWKDCFLILAVAVVIDPRFKMKLIEFSFSRIYGEDAGIWFKAVDDGIHELFHEYIVLSLPLPDNFMEEENEGMLKTEIHLEGTTQDRTPLEGTGQEGTIGEGTQGAPQEETARGPSEDIPSQEVLYHPESHSQEVLYHQDAHCQEVASQDMHLITIGDGLSDFEVYITELTSSQPMKSELDQYLEEPLVPRTQEFDILDWWKLNQLKYPTLSRMASDILSIPLSTVTPDSVFDTTSKKIDSYRSSLRPVTLEALICAKDWLQYGSVSSEIANDIVKLEF